MRQKFQNRIFWCSVVTCLLCLTPTLYFQSAEAFGIGMVVWCLTEWVFLVITWTDKKNRFWVTRYFDPHHPK